jgi:multidrug efflux pump subunit AcrA (membrane-fusion protein)
MKTRLAAIALILVGVGAVALSIIGPNLGGSSSSKYITSTVTVGSVTATSVANGTVAASTVYGLKFGAAPDVVSSAGTTSGTGGSTGNSPTGTSTLAWPVKTVTAAVGQSVKKGAVLAVADDAASQIQLTSAQATLSAAQTKLTTDQGGVDALTKAQAANQLKQSQTAYSQAVANRKLTNSQNANKLAQAKQQVTAAQAKVNKDCPLGATCADDEAALTTAQGTYASTALQVSQSNTQAAQQVTNASLSLASAKLQYTGKVAPAASATIMADQAQVATAQQALDDAQLAVNNASIVAPGDGLIVAVNILPGVTAPTGYAIEMSVLPMVATTSFAEADISNLKVGQAATVTVTAAKATVPGTVTQIVPVAASAGGSSSVVTYGVTVTLDLSNTTATVLSGMSATVTVTTASVDNVMRVPATALQGSATAGYTIRVVGSDGNAQTVAVQVGLVTTSFAQITGGLNQGDSVVVGTTSSRTGTTTTGGGVNLGGLTGGGGGIQGGGFGR